MSSADRSGPPPAGAPSPADRWLDVRRQFEELVDLEPGMRAARLAALATADSRLAVDVAGLLAAAEGNDSHLERAIAEEAALVAAEVAPAAPSLAGLEVGAWRLTAPLGRGGMAEVWAAERIDGELDLRVAVKLLRRGMDSEEVVRRFARERRILSRLDHPAIARIIDGGIAADGRSYLVLERVDGEPITTWCATHDVDLAGRLRLLLEVALAVSAAHRLLVVHRDLKPSNILVTRDGRPKLLDFGIAKLLAGEEADLGATRTELRLLTPAYAAPEQILGEPVSTATDVYALGVLAYELLTGRLPHERANRSLGELASQVTKETLRRPSTAVLETTAVDAHARRRRARDLQGDLDAIVLTALRREPERRYATVDQLADDLRRYLGGQPVAARVDTLAYRVGKLVRRHKLAFALGALAVSGLVLTSGVALQRAGEARQAADAAALEAARASRVKGFLVSLFRQSDPALHPGETLSARQILDAGVAHLDQELADEPEVAADLYDALSEIYTRLGLADQAVDLARRARALREPRAGVDPLALGQTLGREAAAFDLGSDEASSRALPLARRGLMLVEAAAGPDSLAAARARLTLAAAAAWQSDQVQAVALYRAAIATLRRELGSDGLEAAEAEAALAVVLEAMGEYGDAAAAFERSLPVLVAGYGELHPTVARARYQLAGLLDRLGRATEAEPLLDQALAALRQVLGEAHAWTVDAQLSRSILLIGRGRHREAQSELEAILANPGANASLVAQAWRFLGLVAVDLNEPEIASRRFAGAADRFRVLGADFETEALRCDANGGYALSQAGNPRAGEATLARAVAGLTARVGPDDYRLRLPMRQWGEALRAVGRAADSVATLRRTRQLEGLIWQDGEHPEIGATKRELALSLLAIDPKDRSGEAGQLLVEARDLQRRLQPGTSGLAQTLLASGRYALAHTDAPRAHRELAEAAEIFARIGGANDPRAREARLLASRT